MTKKKSQYSLSLSKKKYYIHITGWNSAQSCCFCGINNGNDVVSLSQQKDKSKYASVIEMHTVIIEA
jgi:hypothetical protein